MGECSNHNAILTNVHNKIDNKLDRNWFAAQTTAAQTLTFTTRNVSIY